MKTVEAFERDMGLQPAYIKRLGSKKPIPKSRWKDTVFCGSGDSMAAAMLASSFSNYSITAVDPLELVQNKEMAKGRHVFFVSVSGNTRANILAARQVRHSVAVTKNPRSRLARSCKGVIPLEYSDSGVVTSGSIGFVACALECISQVRRFRVSMVDEMFERAEREARRIAVSGKVFFLGNQHTYPVAMYGAAKLYEMCGLDAHYERVEQFFHTGLFCAKKGDTVILLDGGARARRLAVVLRRLGLGVYCPALWVGTAVDKVVFCIFVSQFVALNLAKRRRQADCHFVLQTNLRDASSQTIY
ncbi:sugar isomerase [Candidatus Nitrosotenuis cloacae]|uniref:sugar isomerase n=1 Tax=Candidatus Nitrosotenuis cloacae TaxID=1603555 RepID=UPI0022829047|nr:sugar isomerase [Candidatus Nitrosotenuis cloacae]